MSQISFFEGGQEELGILIDVKESGMDAFGELRHQVEEVIPLVEMTRVIFERFTGATEEASRAIEEEAGALKEVKKQAAEAGAAVGAYAVINKGLAAAGGGIWAALTFPTGWAQVAMTAIAVLMGPLLMFGGVIAASTAVMVAWTVGATAMVLVLGGLALGFAAVGAAVIALGIANMNQNAAPSAAQVSSAGGAAGSARQRLFDAQQALADLQARIAAGGARHPETLAQRQQIEDLTLRVTRAQDAYNASLSHFGGLAAAQQTTVQQFTAAWQHMLHALEASSVPFAQMALNFGAKLFPTIGKDGEIIIHWFGARLPGALKEILHVFRDLHPVIAGFFGFLGRMFDHFSPKFGPMFEQAIRVSIPIVEGLLTALGRLTDWFIGINKVYGPIVLSILGWVWNAILTLSGVWANFAAWGAKTFWPLLHSIQEEWNKPGVGSGFMAIMKKDLPAIGSMLDEWIKNSPKWLPAILNVAEAFTELATALMWVLTQFGHLVDFLTKFFDNNGAWTSIQNGLISFFKAIGGFLDTIERIIGIDAFGNPTNKPQPNRQGGRNTGGSTGHASGGANSGSGVLSVTQYISGVQNPGATSRAVNRGLRQLMAT